MTERTLPMAQLLAKAGDDKLPLAELMAWIGDGDFQRSVAESVLQVIMEA